MTSDYEKFKTATKTAITLALHNGDTIEKLEKLIESRFVSNKEDVIELKCDYDFELFLKSKSIEVKRPTLIEGKCKCCTPITKVIFPDREFYFYTKLGFNGWGIFRCKNCKKVISYRWIELCN